MAANTSESQQSLGADRHFWTRLQNALGTVAWQVLNEDPATVHHLERAQYANRVIANPAGTAQQLAPSFVNRPNVINFETSYDFTISATVTAAGDPDIESQLVTDWNMLAGVTA
jgi:hypothetical protein